MLQTMTLRQKIGQMIMMGFPASEVTPELRQTLEEYQIGNIILFTHNVVSKVQLNRLCADLQETIQQNTGHAAFISMDQEGGMVARMPADAVSMPAAMAIAATGNPRNAYLAGKITGLELRALGVNMDLAPDMDINSNPDNPVIGVRSFGDTKETVIAFGMEMMKGLRDGGVLPVIKHFPGHGDTAVDSHLGLPKVEKTLEQLEQNELIPFKAAIENGAAGVMSSHILFPNIEKENIPCTMSHELLTGLLREKYGFDGLILTDCLEMDAIRKYYGTAQGALAAIRAGANLLCISHTAALVEETVQTVEQAVHSGELSEDVINAAVEKILKYKARYAEGQVASQQLSGVSSSTHRMEIERISEESITLVHQGNALLPLNGRRTLFVGCYANRTTLASSSVNKDFNFSEYMAEHLDGDYLVTPINPTEQEMEQIMEKAQSYQLIVFGMYNGQRKSGQIELANRLCSVCGSVTAVSLFNPYDLASIDEQATKIAAYEYTVLSFNTLIRVFNGEVIPQGKLSVQI
jgi:Beta-glucosidase-related glycosidases